MSNSFVSRSRNRVVLKWSRTITLTFVGLAGCLGLAGCGVNVSPSASLAAEQTQGAGSPKIASSGVILPASALPAVVEPNVQPVRLTGSGFPTSTILASGITVTLAPATAGAGPTVQTAASGFTRTVGSIASVIFLVPPSLVLAAPTPYLVSIAGTAGGSAFNSSNTSMLTIDPPAGVSVQPGTGQQGQSLTVNLQGTYSNFLQGGTTASFGPGISVGGAAAGTAGTVTVTSLTTATASLVIASNANVGPLQVVVTTGAEVESAAFSVSAFSVIDNSGAPASITATAGTPQSGTIGTSFAAPLAAMVKDSNGNPVSGATVTFNAPGSGAGGTFAGGVNTAITNANGIAVSAVFTANSTAGSYSVMASVSGLVSVASFPMTNVPGPAASIIATSGTPQSATIGTSFAAPLVATVEDSGGNPVSGATVTFAAPGSGAGGTFAGGVNTATTNAGGVATSAVFTANSTAGSDSVTASVSGVSATAVFSLTNNAGPPASITATSGTPQSANVGTAFAAPLVATVKDSGGNLLSGVTVVFAPPASGASGTFAGGVNTATTNGSGVATSAVFTANSTSGGPYNVVAGVSGLTPTASFVLNNTTPIPTTLSLNVNSLNLGAQNAGTTSASQSITATNTGGATVTFTGITLADANPSEFAIASNTCGTTLGAGATCTVALTFTPAANGARSATLQFADNATGSPQSALLTGTGQSATQNLIFLQPNLAFRVSTLGTQSVAATTVENVGTAPVTVSSYQVTGPNASEFAITSNTCGTLAENANCNVLLTFSPAGAGLRVANLQMNDNAPGSPHSVPLYGTGESVTQTVSQSVTNIDFGSANTGSTVSNSFTLNNIGTAAATLNAAVLSGMNSGDFAITSTNCPIGPATFGPGANCSVNVSFTPTATGVRVATITVTDNTPESPHVVMLTGVGQPVTQITSQSATNVGFGVANVGAAITNSFTLFNLGTGPVSLNAAVLGGSNQGDFSIASTTCPTTAFGFTSGGSCTVNLSFTPTAPGVRTATVTVLDSSLQSPHIVQLTGTGQAVTQITAQSATNVVFGLANVGVKSTSSFLLYNLGTGPVTLNAPVIGGANPGDFSIPSSGCPTSTSGFAPGASCMISVSFTPTAGGVRTATVTVKDNSSQSPHVVNLTGVGQPVTPTLSLSSGTLTFGALTIGAYVNSSFTVYNLGSVPVSLSSFVLGGADPGDFTISVNSCGSTLSPGAACVVLITFIPTALGSRTATVTVTDSALGSPQTVNLEGVGETAVPQISFDVVSLDRGVSPVGHISGSGSQTVTAYNTGQSAISLTSVTISGANAADFSVLSTTCRSTLAVGGSCVTYVNFTPSAVGARTASLLFTDSVPGSPQSIALTGLGEAVSQVLTLSPPSLVFPSETIGNTSGNMVVNAFNTGDVAITITNTSFALGGPNPGDFSLGSNSCQSATIGAGSDCQSPLTFTPSAAGLRTATLTFSSTAPNGPQTLQLFGTGVPSPTAISFSPNDYNFGTLALGATSSTVDVVIGNVTSGAPMTITGLTLTGPNAGDFALGTGTCGATLAAGASCAQNVTFTPTGLGQRIAALQLTDNGAGSPQLAGLAGFGAPSTQTVSTLEMALDFGVENIGVTSSQQYIIVSNTGAVTTNINGFTLAGTNPGDFTVASTTCGATLGPGSNCLVYITFTPLASGIRTTLLQIADTATGSPQTVMLAGEGQTPGQNLTVITPALAFGVQNDGTTSSYLYASVENTGTATVAFSGITITGANAADFSIYANPMSCPSSLAQNTACNVYIEFTPSAPGVRAATLNFIDNAVGSPHTVSLTGVGQDSSSSGENLVVTTPALAFGVQNDGTTSSGQSAYVKSTGTATVTFSSFTITGPNAADFAIGNNTCPSNMVENATCYLYIDFIPSAPGVRTATLNFNDNAPGSPHTASLTGVGLDTSTAAENLVVTPTALAFATQNDGTSSSAQAVSVQSTGTGPVTIGSYTFTGANAADFSYNNNNCPSAANPLTENATCSIQVTFTPSAPGVRTATLNFNDSAPGSPHTVSVSGVGQDSSTSAKNLVVTTPTLVFGVQDTGVTSASQSSYVKSTGTAPVTFSSYTITGTNATDFAIAYNLCANIDNNQLPENISCFVNVTFTPSGLGVRTATLTFNDDALGSPHTVSLTGVGQDGSTAAENLVVTTPVLAFGSQNDNTTSNYQVAVVRSTGTAPVTFSSVTITGANPGDFAISNDTCLNSGFNPLPENSYCDLDVTFTPIAPGARTATLNFNDNAPGSPHTALLTGLGQVLTDTLAITTPTTTFAAQRVGTTSSDEFIDILNTGTGPVILTGYTLAGANPGDFAIIGNSCTSSYSNSLPASASCYVVVNFTPGATGSRSATLNFFSNAAGSPLTAVLSGTGQ
jgi:hypothetical protein